MSWHHKGLSSKHCQSRCVRNQGTRGLGRPFFGSTHSFEASCSLKNKVRITRQSMPGAFNAHVHPCGPAASAHKRLLNHQPWEASFSASVLLHMLFPLPRMPFLLCAPNKLLLFPQGPVPKSFLLCEVSLSVVSLVPPLTLYTLGS